MSPDAPLSREDEGLLRELRLAVKASPSPPTQIEVGIALSITLGRMRPSVSCGGCSTPLEFEGIPALTNARLTSPFRLRYDPVAPAESASGT
jgi:hypothetical protein